MVSYAFSNNTSTESSISKRSSFIAADKPTEVKQLKRSNTTGSTFAGARPTKKTLLLRWCQKVTEEYDVSVCVCLCVCPFVRVLFVRACVWCIRFSSHCVLCLSLLPQNVDIRNFSDSFSDGLAFCAIIHHFSPSRIPFISLNAKTRVG